NEFSHIIVPFSHSTTVCVCVCVYLLLMFQPASSGIFSNSTSTQCLKFSAMSRDSPSNPSHVCRLVLYVFHRVVVEVVVGFFKEFRCIVFVFRTARRRHGGRHLATLLTKSSYLIGVALSRVETCRHSRPRSLCALKKLVRHKT